MYRENTTNCLNELSIIILFEITFDQLKPVKASQILSQISATKKVSLLQKWLRGESHDTFIESKYLQNILDFSYIKVVISQDMKLPNLEYPIWKQVLYIGFIVWL